MIDKEKKILQDGVISIFDKFNILNHTATIGGLKNDILKCIDSLHEEPSKDFRERYKKIAQTKAFKKAHRGSVGEEMPVEEEEPISEELDTSIIGYLNNVEPAYSNTFYSKEQMQNIARHFANWQKLQMMKNAVEGYIRRNRYTKTNVLHGLDVTCEAIQKFKDDDKVKIIILKEK